MFDRTLLSDVPVATITKHMAGALLAMAFTAVPVHGAALPSSHRLVKTDEGCQVAITVQDFDAMTKGDVQSRFSWKGRCVASLANGLGEFRKESRFGSGDFQSTSTVVIRQRFHEGVALGYGLASVDILVQSRQISSKSGIYAIQGKEFHFSGAYLTDDASLLDLPFGTLPNINLDILQDRSSIASPAGLFTFNKGPCGVFQAQLPDCRFENGKFNQEVFYVSVTPPLPGGGLDFARTTRTLCPSRELQGCIPMVKALATPILQAGLDLVRNSADEGRRLRIAMDQSPEELAKAQKEQDERAARLVVEGKARADQEETEFQSKLKTAAVGQLYAIGDELQAKGDKQRARAAYRALLGRFPDHALAQTAAKAMSDLQ